jgi:hypothetical protein
MKKSNALKSDIERIIAAGVVRGIEEWKKLHNVSPGPTLKNNVFPFPSVKPKVILPSAYPTNYEFMHKVLISLYNAYKRPIQKNEWWDAIQKCNTKGGRAPSFSKCTFRQYTYMYNVGLWERKNGGYIPLM